MTPRKYFRHRKKNYFLHSSDNAVASALRKVGLTEFARRIQIAAIWKQAVGPDIAERTQPQSMNRGTLVIKAATAAWQNELTFLKADLIKRLNDALAGRLTVRNLKVVCGTLESLEEEDDLKGPWMALAPTQDDLDTIEDASQPIEDDEVKAQFEKAMTNFCKAQKVKSK